MATYIQLLILTTEGRERALEDPQSVMRAQQAVATPDIQVLGVYAVLGEYDFVNIVAAEDNEAIARFSLKLGVRAGAHITTLPAIPIGRFGATGKGEPQELEQGAARTLPDEP